MIKAFTAVTAQTPYGNVLMSEVNDPYAVKSGRQLEEGQYEPEILSVIKTSAFDVFFDIGAAFGYFSLVAASKPGVRVIAAEPHPIRFGYLWWNCREKENITILNRFVGPGSEEAFFTKNPGGLFGKKIGDRIQSSYTPESIAPAYVIAPFAMDKKVLVKIDVEGFEKEILESCNSLREDENVDYLVEVHTDLVDLNYIKGLFAEREVRTIMIRGNTTTLHVV